MVASSRSSAIVLLGIAVVLMGIVLSYSMGSQCIDKASGQLEAFVASQTLPMAAYNLEMNNVNCKRQLAFAYQPNADKPVNQRAIIVQSDASCPSSMKAVLPSEELVQVTENEIDYTLRSKCFNIPCKTIELFANGEIVKLVFDMKNVDKLRDFFLSNPLFIQINGSTAYIPDYQASATKAQTTYSDNDTANFSFTTWKGAIKVRETDKDFYLQCKRLNANAGGLQYTDTKTLFDTNGLIFPTNVNVTSYYLEIQESASASLEVVHNPDRKKPVQAIKIYDINYYNTLPTTDKKFFFHQKLSVLLSNKRTPVFTFSFAFKLKKNMKTDEETVVFQADQYIYEFFRVFMDVPFGTYSAPSAQFVSIDGNSRGNLLRIGAKGDDTTFQLQVDLMAHNTNQPSSVNNNTKIVIELPYSHENNSFTTRITVTPFEIISFIQWNDEKNNYHYLYKRSSRCDPNSLFTKLFTNPQERGNVGDMYLKYNNVIVTALDNVMLGYRRL